MDEQTRKYEELNRKLEEVSRQLRELQAQSNLATQSLKGARVRIDNLEGSFKTLTAAPSTGFQNGSLVLTDIATTRKINVLINGTWYSVTVT